MTDLEARYGRTAGRRRRDRLIALGVGAVVAAVMIAWVVWAGVGQPTADIEVQNIGHRGVDDRHVAVDFSVTAPERSAIRCAVQALDSRHGTVGWLETDLPVTDARTARHTIEVRTSAPAVSGLVYRCWLR